MIDVTSGNISLADEKPDIPVIDIGTADEGDNESYFQLVWRRFRRSKVSIIGAFMVLILVVVAIFADFFSPTPIDEIDLKSSFIPPQVVHFVDHDGNFHLRPFVYNYS